MDSPPIVARGQIVAKLISNERSRCGESSSDSNKRMCCVFVVGGMFFANLSLIHSLIVCLCVCESKRTWGLADVHKISLSLSLSLSLSVTNPLPFFFTFVEPRGCESLLVPPMS